MIFAVLLAFGGYSCGPNLSDYEYIYLGETMDVVESGKSNISRIKFHGDMPVRYRLEREDFKLTAVIDRDSIQPHVTFQIASDTMIGLQLEGSFAPVCYGQFDRPSGSETNAIHSTVRFRWARVYVRQCSDVVPPNQSELVLNLSILDFSGKVIANEKIPFSANVNGIYYEFDGL